MLLGRRRTEPSSNNQGIYFKIVRTRAMATPDSGGIFGELDGKLVRAWRYLMTHFGLENLKFVKGQDRPLAQPLERAATDATVR